MADTFCVRVSHHNDSLMLCRGDCIARTLAVVRHVAGHDGIHTLAGLQAEVCGKFFYCEKLQGTAVAQVCGKLFIIWMVSGHF